MRRLRNRGKGHGVFVVDWVGVRGGIFVGVRVGVRLTGTTACRADWNG